MKTIFVILAFASNSIAMQIPLPTLTPDDLEVKIITKANVCHILWTHPFMSDVSLVDRVRMNDLCEIVERLPPELQEKFPDLIPEQ